MENRSGLFLKSIGVKLLRHPIVRVRVTSSFVRTAGRIGMYLRILLKGGHIKPNMQSLTTVLIACLALTSAAPVSVLEMRDTPADSGTMLTLPPFSRILANVPFNVLVMPGMYSVKTAADKVVTDALQTNVTNGLLTLTTNTSFSTNKPIKVQHLLTFHWQCTLPRCTFPIKLQITRETA